jgi:hypothetical protein
MFDEEKTDIVAVNENASPMVTAFFAMQGNRFHATVSVEVANGSDKCQKVAGRLDDIGGVLQEGSGG